MENYEEQREPRTEIRTYMFEGGIREIEIPRYPLPNRDPVFSKISQLVKISEKKD